MGILRQNLLPLAIGLLALVAPRITAADILLDESPEELAFDSFQVVPEPGGLITLACGVMLLVLLTRWRMTSGRSSRRS